MASSTPDQPAASSSATSAPQQVSPKPPSRPGSGHDALATSPVEMRTLPPSSTEPPSTSQPAAVASAAPSTKEPPSSIPQSQDDLPAQSTSAAQESIAPSKPAAAAPSTLTRSETEAIGPSSDTPAAKPDDANGPVVIITLLLPTTGARHPYKIDEKYLKKRNVNVEAMDPYNISVYTLKELIWRDWREEWEPRPTSPSSIRLIHFGRMLDDKLPLKECRFQTEAPNVVHMTVKPQEVVDEEDAKTGKGGNRRDDGEEPTAGCRCVIL